MPRLCCVQMAERVFYEQVVAIGLPQILGAVSAAVSARSVATWYKNDVRKPKWHPPLPLFGAIWPILYFFIGFASYIVYVEGMVAKRYAGPLTLYALQLALNVAWQPLFFEVRNWRLAQLDNIGTCIALDLLRSFNLLECLSYRKQVACCECLPISPSVRLFSLKGTDAQVAVQYATCSTRVEMQLDH